jgi:uncharacterized membrane protein YqgA involved in biofilm formation
MIGVLVNTILVVVGSVIGMVFRKGMPVNITKTVMIGLGLFTSIFGIKMVQTRDDASFTRGYVFASLLFCVGPMTVLGSLQAGLQNQPELLLVKSLMDGVSAIVLSATLGIGVAFSALTVLVFQGSLVLLAGQLHFLTEPVYFDNLTGVGGILIFGIGIKLLNLAEIKVGNFLPALLLVVIFSYIATLI